MRDDTQEWEMVIGKFILAFGSLELALLRLYEIKLPERNYFSDDFDKRFKKLIGYLKRNSGAESSIEALIELKKYSETRHLLAHSTLYADIYKSDKTNEFFVERAIRSSKEPDKEIALDQLISESQEVERLVALLYSDFQHELWRSND